LPKAYYFLCLETKKVTKENSRLADNFWAPALKFAHAIQLTPTRLLVVAQTVLLSTSHRNKL
jgi:hypothetical protein